jgi:hypothetical protein
MPAKRVNHLAMTSASQPASVPRDPTRRRKRLVDEYDDDDDDHVNHELVEDLFVDDGPNETLQDIILRTGPETECPVPGFGDAAAAGAAAAAEPVRAAAEPARAAAAAEPARAAAKPSLCFPCVRVYPGSVYKRVHT